MRGKKEAAADGAGQKLVELWHRGGKAVCRARGPGLAPSLPCCPSLEGAVRGQVASGVSKMSTPMRTRAESQALEEAFQSLRSQADVWVPRVWSWTSPHQTCVRTFLLSSVR